MSMRLRTRRLLRGLAALLLLGVLTLLVLLERALDDEPLVARSARAMSTEDLMRLQRMLRAADPRRAPDEVALRLLRIDSADLDRLTGEATRRLLHLSSRVQVEAGRATLQASLEVPASPFGRWLDLEVRLRETPGLPVIEQIRLGRLPVPIALAEGLLRHELARRGLADQAQLLLDMVRRVSLRPQDVEIAYVWQPDLSARLKASMVPQALQPRLQAHASELARRVRHLPDPLPLATLLPAMLGFAAERCGACPAKDLTAEYRSALVVMALHASGQPLSRLLPQARDWPRAPARSVLLRGRIDFAMHFLISAVLAAEGGGRLSDTIGLYKEVADSRDGSGFSFNDLAADRAGTRFGQIVRHDPARLQAAVQAGQPWPEALFMPTVDGLPEFMPQAQFLTRYGGVGAPAYQRMMAEIEQRVRSRPLLR